MRHAPTSVSPKLASFVDSQLHFLGFPGQPGKNVTILNLKNPHVQEAAISNILVSLILPVILDLSTWYTSQTQTTRVQLNYYTVYVDNCS